MQGNNNVFDLPNEFYELFKLINDIQNGEVSIKIRQGLPVHASVIREQFLFKGGVLWTVKVSGLFSNPQEMMRS